MKVYIFCVDWDMTMRSVCRPNKVFKNKEDAELKLEDFKENIQNCDAEIQEFEVIEHYE